MAQPPYDPAQLRGWWLSHLTDQWEWETELPAVAGFDEAKAAARAALERLVREEAPSLACVTLLQDGRRVGVWDWVERQPYWTPF